MPPFPKGHRRSRGRPRGSRNKATILMEQLSSDAPQKAAEIINKELIVGTRWAAAMVVRVMPKLRGNVIEIDLPEIKTAADVQAAQARIIEAMACGEITTGDARTATDVLQNHLRTIEVALLEKQLEALESAVAQDRELYSALETLKQP